MMNKKRTKEIGRTKYLMFLPLAALLMIVSNIETVDAYHKEDCGGSHRSCRSPNRQPAPEVQDPQVAPQPEQDTKTVTYKGKVVDKDGKPIQGVKILSVPNSTPTEVTTQADGSF